MKRNIHQLALTLLAASLLTLTACEKERLVRTVGINFTATMEQPSSDNKVYLENERWIYWEEGDVVNISSDEYTFTDEPQEGYLSGASVYLSEFNAAFYTDLAEGSDNFLALYPCSANNRIRSAGKDGNTFSVVQICLPGTQPYREDEKGDLTFAKQVLPMVAWYGDGGVNSTPNLDFHNLAGIVRLQFYNSTGKTYYITSINVSSASQQLAGMFNVVDYKTYNPHLTSLENSPANRQLTLSMPTDGLQFRTDSLRSFYLVLPATANMDGTTQYTLNVTVNARLDGDPENTNYSFTKSLTVPSRRNGITYTRAVGITSFTAGQTTLGIVGNGTMERPFKIYTAAELKYVRDSFANPRGGKVYINGQEVTENTQFRIMRSDIVLHGKGTDTWTRGIPNFKGHMTYYSNAAVEVHGITNRSNKPLFESITADGVVEGLTVKCDSLIHAEGETYSPLCGTNYGQIIECHATTPPAGSMTFYGTAFAGICVSNDAGIIQGSSCSVKGSFIGNFAGICYNNINKSGNSKILGCIASSPMSIDFPGATQRYAAGIAFNNSDSIRDCYFDAHYTSGTAIWGGISIYNQASGKIRHCYVSQSAMIHTTTVGGIVCYNYGLVNYCWSNGELRGTHVGAIVSTLSNGRLVNCFVNDTLCVITLQASASPHCAGAIAAEMTGGAIDNCFAYIHHIARNDATGVYGALVGKVTGGTITNCYAREAAAAVPRFYGTNSGGTFNRCWIVGTETQEGLTGKLSSSAADLALLIDDNHLNKSSLPELAKAWIAGPALSAFSLGS